MIDRIVDCRNSWIHFFRLVLVSSPWNVSRIDILSASRERGTVCTILNSPNVETQSALGGYLARLTFTIYSATLCSLHFTRRGEGLRTVKKSTSSDTSDPVFTLSSEPDIQNSTSRTLWRNAFCVKRIFNIRTYHQCSNRKNKRWGI